MSRNASRIALVTGGTGGLGTAVVRRLIQDGFRVHVPFRTRRDADALVSLLGGDRDRVSLVETDVTRPDAVEALVGGIAETDGALDLLVNGVGGFVHGPLADTDPEDWERMLRLNATSCFLCSRAALPLLGRNGGRIVNVGAVPALRGTGARMSAYAASKAAVLSLTASLAQELRGAGITVNAIVPTTIDTPANRKAMPDADPARWVSPEEIARVIAFLAGPDAAVVTGSVLVVDRV